MSTITNTIGGFSKEAITEWVSRKLGSLVWRSEGFDCSDEAAQGIEDAAMKYSEQVPMFRFTNASSGATKVPMPEDAFGVIHCFFIDGTMVFTQTAYDLNKSLNGVSSLQMAGGNVGEFADFLQWRKMFHRVLSQRPTWQVDEAARQVLIHNPSGYAPCILFSTIRPFEKIQLMHRTWIRDWALAEAKERLGQARGKYPSGIPGPGGSPIQTNSSQLLDDAKASKEKLEEKLLSMRPTLPMMFD